MNMNQVQKKVVSVVVPIIIILLGFAIIGSSGSTDSIRFGGSGITFNPFSYLERHGGEWTLVVLLIGAFEFFWWRDPKKKTEQY